MSSQRAAVAPPIASAVRAAWRHRPADDRHVPDALRLHVLRGELAHLAGAEDDDRAAVEVAEDLLGERDRGVADRDGAGAERGFRPHALADGEGRVEQAVEQRSGGFGLPGGAVRFFDLAENLRLADDQRIEAGRDAEQVAGRFEVGDLVDVRLERRSVHAVKRADERDQLGSCRRDVVARDVELGAIARREHRHLAGRGALRRAGRERAQRVLEAARLEIDALAQLDRRGPMADSDEQEVHLGFTVHGSRFTVHSSGSPSLEP